MVIKQSGGQALRLRVEEDLENREAESRVLWEPGMHHAGCGITLSGELVGTGHT